LLGHYLGSPELTLISESPMTIVLTLPPEVEQKLRTEAARRGKEVTALVEELIDRGLAVSPTLDQILAPFRREVEVSGLTDEELDALLEEAREEAWKARQGLEQ